MCARLSMTMKFVGYDSGKMNTHMQHRLPKTDDVITVPPCGDTPVLGGGILCT